MLERAHKISDLIARHMKGEVLSSDEQLALDQWLKSSELTLETLDIHVLKNLAEYTAKAEIYYQNTGNRLPRVIRMHALKRKIVRFSAVAAGLVIVAGATYFILYRTPETQKEQITVTPSQPEINPASSKAILTLADNSTIELDASKSGTVAFQGTSVIRSSQEGLLYDQSTASSSDKNKFSGLNTVTTPRGGFYRITLSDGSGVWLNAASSIKFPPAFTGSQRVVELTGEGYFEIKEQHIPGTRNKMPFFVKTDNGMIEVTGTKFNVNAYSETNQQVTTLLEGAVTIHSDNNNIPARQLLPGQKAIQVTEKAIQIQAANVKAATSWKDGWFSFEQASIKEVMRQISLWYGVDIVYTVQHIPQGAVMNGYIERNIPLSDLLIRLEETIGKGIQLTLKGNQVVVSWSN